jgi:hypothetical protein
MNGDPSDTKYPLPPVEAKVYWLSPSIDVWVCRVKDIPQRYWNVTEWFWQLDASCLPEAYVFYHRWDFVKNKKHVENMGRGRKGDSHTWACLPIEFKPEDSKPEWGEYAY